MSQQPADKQEEPRRTKNFMQWKGINTRASRNAIPDDCWYNLLNMQPIGDANIHNIADKSAVLFDYTTHPVYWADYANVGGKDYIISATTDGFVYAWDIAGAANTQIGSGFSGSLTRFAQWKNTAVLTFDNTFGYGYWNGAGVFTAVAGAGVPTGATNQVNDIAVTFGRVWISTGRLLTFTAVGAGTNGAILADFLVANGAGTVNTTDPTMRNVITRLRAQNGYLYVASASSINAISDVYVPAGASPPTPLFTNLNIQGIIGSDQPGSFFDLNQALMFANAYGAWALYGTQAERISMDIDGTWQYRDPSQQISGGQVVSQNILCAAFLVKVASPPANIVSGLGMYQDGIWWFANFGALTFVLSALANNIPSLFGFIGNKLYQLFANYASSPGGVLVSKLWPMEDNLADKEVIRAGFEANIFTSSGNFSVTVDTVNSSYSMLTSNQTLNIAWVNNAGVLVTWQNNVLSPVNWYEGSYLLYNGVAPGVYGKYVGMTISYPAGMVWQFNALNMDYKLRARWG